MRLAVLADVHGNVEALDALLKDASSRGAESYLHLGDLVGYGPRPNEAVARIREANIKGVVGNYDLAVRCDNYNEGRDRYLRTDISMTNERVYRWTRKALTDETRDFLGSLPAQVTIEEADAVYHFVHGSPEDPKEYLTGETSEERLLKLFDGTGADVLVAAHTHVPLLREVGYAKLLVNPGSVGRPKDGDPRSSYCIIDTEDNLKIENVRVAFNVESVAKESVRFGLPAEEARALALGRGI